MGDKLPLATGVHSFALSNKFLENSEVNKGYRSVIIDYLKAHDR
jgi:hypothetical protein